MIDVYSMYYNHEASRLCRWGYEELLYGNRLKSYKLFRIANKMEKKYRKKKWNLINIPFLGILYIGNTPITKPIYRDEIKDTVKKERSRKMLYWSFKDTEGYDLNHRYDIIELLKKEFEHNNNKIDEIINKTPVDVTDYELQYCDDILKEQEDIMKRLKNLVSDVCIL